MSLVAPPIRKHQAAQELIRWGYLESEAALGRRSNMPAVIAAIEGRSAGWRGISLDEDPAAAIDQIDRAARLSASRRYRIFVAGIRGMPAGQRVLLDAVYAKPPEPRLESFGSVANIARFASVRVRGQSTKLDWLARLSHKVLPSKDERGRRKTPTATDAEQRLHLEILLECQTLLTAAIEAWIDASGGARLEQRRRARGPRRRDATEAP